MNQIIVGSPDKTSLLLNQICSRLENGSLVVDPTGALAPQLADRIPHHRTERTVYIDPSDTSRCVGLNVLENVPEPNRHQLAEDICAFFDAMFPEGSNTLSRAKAHYILLNCLRILLDTPHVTLLGINRLLTDKSYRHACIQNCTDPKVLSFWQDEFNEKDPAIGTLQSKVGGLLTSPTIRNILGQPHSTFSFDCSVVANLDRSKLGNQTAYLLGSLLIARSKHHVFINDFGFYASEHFVNFLPQQRFTLSFNFLHELPPKLRQAALTIEDKVVLKTTPEDAEHLIFSLHLHQPSQLTELSRGEFMTPDGLHTIPPTVPPLQRFEAISKRSQARHTVPRTKVERLISAQL